MKRDKSADYVKAIAAVLVVIFHIPQLTGGMLESVWSGFILFLYTTHVPAFFVVSGVMLEKSMRKYAPIEVIKNKFFNIQIVGVIWTLLYIPMYNNDLSRAFHNMWYFYFLFAGVLIIVAATFVKINNRILSIILFLLFIILAFYSRQFSKLFLHVLLIEFGYLLGEKGCGINLGRKNSLLVLVVYCLSYIIYGMIYDFNMSNENQMRIPLILLMLLKIVGAFVIPSLVSLFCNIDSDDIILEKFNKCLSYIGENSLTIYILQWPFCRIVENIPVVSIWQMLLEVIICLVICSLLTEVIKKIRLYNLLFRPYELVKKLCHDKRYP